MLLLASALPLTAQAPRFSIAAGPAIPIAGIRSETHSNGFNVQAGVGVGNLDRPLSVRIDGFYSSFGGKAVPGDADREYSDEWFIGVTANGVYTLDAGSVRPYAIAGLGFYNEYPGLYNVGLNAGVGARLPVGRIRPFAEVRFHNFATLGGSEYRFGSPARTASLSLGISF